MKTAIIIAVIAVYAAITRLVYNHYEIKYTIQHLSLIDNEEGTEKHLLQVEHCSRYHSMCNISKEDCSDKIMYEDVFVLARHKALRWPIDFINWIFFGRKEA